MKFCIQNIIVIAAGLVAIADATRAFGAVTTCMSYENCTKSMLCSGDAMCCPTGNMGTTKSCPTGWGLSGSTCTRSATNGSDSSGYYTQTYGTCNPKETSFACYEISTTYTDSKQCAACLNGGMIISPGLDSGIKL